MNMQKLMMEAQKMQAKLQKEQAELENTSYEGNSSLVKVVINGKKEVTSVKLNIEEEISTEDVEMLSENRRNWKHTINIINIYFWEKRIKHESKSSKILHKRRCASGR